MNSLIDKLVESSNSSLSKPGDNQLQLPKYQGQGLTLFVFRHGQTHDNIRRIFSGRRNSALTVEGVGQALNLANKMHDLKIDIGFSPSLDRCRKTLSIVLKSHPKAKIIIDDLLVERDYGDLSGKSKLSLQKKDPVLTARYRRDYDFPPPNGESLKMVWENRINPFCDKIKNFVLENNVNVAICCTNNTMRLIRMKFENLSIEQMQLLENPLASDYCSYEITS